MIFNYVERLIFLRSFDHGENASLAVHRLRRLFNVVKLKAIPSNLYHAWIHFPIDKIKYQEWRIETKSKTYSRQRAAANNSEMKLIKFTVEARAKVKASGKRRRWKKFDLYKVNYSLMINITTESNQSFTSEFWIWNGRKKYQPDFFLFQLLIILPRRSEEKKLSCQFHLNFHNL